MPKRINAMATAPFVLNVAVGLVLNESTSGNEQNQIWRGKNGVKVSSNSDFFLFTFVLFTFR